VSESQNLLFVTVDCLRQDFTANDWATTPFIDDLRESGIEYQELYSTTTTTTPSVASLLTGTYSERNGVNSLRNVELNEQVRTMAESFREAGFETAALVTGPLVEETGISRGFDHFNYRDKDMNLVDDWYEEAVSHLNSLSSPFFMYLHLWEIHTPVTVPPEYDNQKYGKSPYARGLSALDGRLEQFVKETPKNTTVVLHGDHGESISWREHLVQKGCKKLRDKARYEFGLDTRSLERLANRLLDPFSPPYKDHFIESGHGETILDFMTNVPFILSGPNIEPETVSAQCRQVDILPTLLDVFDLPLASKIDGQSLLPPESVDDRTAYIRACGASLRGESNWQRGVRTPEYKYVEYPNRDWGPELFDLTDDKTELRNVASAHPETLSELQNQLPTQELLDVGSMDIDDHLRDLGYL
jgi:arylsulfatase A-like enzyme